MKLSDLFCENCVWCSEIIFLEFTVFTISKSKEGEKKKCESSMDADSSYYLELKQTIFSFMDLLK